jgi:UDP-N-acetylmuramoyl-tripeptide--D-alanyl-D-alanine ligase
MYLLINTLWFIWMLKYVLFWLYLWQLKEYHTGRFIDHFRTYKGKKVLFSLEQAIKLILLFFLLLSKNYFGLIFSIALLVYLAETVLFLRSIYRRSAKKPVPTIKMLLLSAVSFAFIILFLYWDSWLDNNTQLVWLLVFDILVPLIVSVIVLALQPFFVIARNIKIKKAEEKLEKIKLVSGVNVIVITGSYGKTSTKEFLKTILSHKFKVLATDKHQNSEIGVANCILNDLKPSHQIFIAEVGAYNKGKVKEVCGVLKPKIGIVTGVNEQHLALFGSLENLLSAEGGGELAETLQKDGLLIANGDNKYCLSLYKKFDGNKKVYSLSNKIINSDIWSESISVFKDYISFLAVDKTGEMAHFNARVLGKQNVQNLLAAILVAKQLGMNFGEISEACKNIKQDQAGMALKKNKLGFDIVDSSYSANPDGVFADLDYFSIFSNQKVIVMPCLIELGKKSSEIHEKIGRKIGEICDFAIITSRDKFKEIERGFYEGQKQRKGPDVLKRSHPNVAKCILCEKPQDIYSEITLFCESGDAVLLEGRTPGGVIKLLFK